MTEPKIEPKIEPKTDAGIATPAPTEPTQPIEKVCTKCGKPKKLDDFYKNHAGKYGRDSKCKTCKDLYNKECAARKKAKTDAGVRPSTASVPGAESWTGKRYPNPYQPACKMDGEPPRFEMPRDADLRAEAAGPVETGAMERDPWTDDLRVPAEPYKPGKLDVTIDFSSMPDMYADLEEIALDQLRTMDNLILWLLKTMFEGAVGTAETMKTLEVSKR